LKQLADAFGGLAYSMVQELEVVQGLEATNWWRARG
jgi:hypothetical protein